MSDENEDVNMIKEEKEDQIENKMKQLTIDSPQNNPQHFAFQQQNNKNDITRNYAPIPATNYSTAQLMIIPDQQDQPTSIYSGTSSNSSRYAHAAPYINRNRHQQSSSSQSSSSSSRRTNTDEVAAAQMNEVTDSDFERLLHPSVLSHIANLVAQTNVTISEEKRNLLKGIPIANSASHLRELLLQIDNGSRYYILSMYRRRKSVIQLFLYLALGISKVALESQNEISNVVDDTEKKNALLNALYSGSFAQGPTTGYTFITAESLEVIPPLWHVASCKNKNTDYVVGALQFLVSKFPLFTFETMDQFIREAQTLNANVKSVLINLLIQYYFFDKCLWSPSALKLKHYYSIQFPEFGFVLIPNYCPIKMDSERTVLGLPLYTTPKQVPLLNIGGDIAVPSESVQRSTFIKNCVEYSYTFPKKEEEGVVDAGIIFDNYDQTRKEYVTYYRPGEGSQPTLLPSTTASSSAPKEKRLSKDFTPLSQVSLNNSTIQNNVLQYKSKDLYGQSPYHHLVYKNQLDDKSIDNLNMFDRKILFCFDEDKLGRTVFQTAFAVSNIITIEKLLPKLFDSTKIEDRIELIYHLYKVNEFGEWAAGLALKNIKVEYEMLREYLAMTYQIIIPQEPEDDEDDEEEDETEQVKDLQMESYPILKEGISQSPSFNLSAEQTPTSQKPLAETPKATTPTTQIATVEQEDMNYPIQYKKYWFPLKYYSARLVVSKNKTTNEYEVKIYAPKSDEIYFSANNVKSLKWTVYNSKTNEYILNLLPSKHSFYIKFESNSVKVPIASSSSSANNSPVSSSPTQKKSLFPVSSVSEYVSSTNEGITTLLPTSNPLSVLDSVPESKRFVEELLNRTIMQWTTEQVSKWLSFTRIIEDDKYIPLSESKVQSETLKRVFQANFITGATLLKMNVDDLLFFNFKEPQIIQLAEEIELLKNENIDNSQLCYMTLKLDQEQENRSATEMYELYKQRSALVNISQFKYYFMNIDNLSQLLLFKLPTELIIYEDEKDGNKVKYGLYILSTWFLEWNDKSMLCIPQRKAPSPTLFRFTIYWIDNQKEIIVKLIDAIVKFIVDRNANENLEDKNGMNNIQFVEQLASKTQMNKGLEIALQHWQYSNQHK